MSDLETLRERLVTTRLPVGTMRVPHYEHWISTECLAADRPVNNELHLVWILIGALRDMGVTYRELFDLAEVSLDDGSLYGGVRIESRAPLFEDVDYEIEAQILDLERKSGARLGVFDLLTFEVRVRLADEVLASAVSTFILGRGKNAD